MDATSSAGSCGSVKPTYPVLQYRNELAAVT